MKVLDLQCALGHPFEGWFASEQDFVAQSAQAQVQCPLCGDPTITKKLSAPRLNLAAKRADPPEAQGAAKENALQEVALPAKPQEALVAAWMAMARQVLANTTDVGDQFAQEARKIHYGETEERSIRGQATRQETLDLAEEGIEVMPFALPEALKKTLQ